MEVKELLIKETNSFFDCQRELDNLYPDRHTTIHKSPCKHCPSHQDKLNGRLDPESEEIKTYPKELIAKEFLFVCYCRQSKLCKGLCDNMGIDEEYLKSLNNQELTLRGDNY
jgi:hypothetical protein